MNRLSLHRRKIAAGLVVVAQLSASAARADDGPPVAPLRPVIDEYFGTAVTDNYRYFENLADPEVQRWMRAQSTHTQQVLAKLPGRPALLERIHDLSNADAQRNALQRRGNRYFYELFEPGTQQPRLYYRDGLAGEEHLLIDPARLGEGSNTHYALDYFQPSWDGRYVAYGVSAGGSEASELHVIEVATGKVLGEAISRTDNAVIAWRPDNRSFFYLRYPQPRPDLPAHLTMFNARTYLHELGKRVDGDGDAAVFGRGVAAGVDVPDGQGTYIVSAPDGRYAIAVANHNMDENPATLFVAPMNRIDGPRTPWRRLASVEDGITDFDVRGDTLFALSLKDAPRGRVLAVPLATADLRQARVLLPEGDGITTDLTLARDGLYVSQRTGGTSRLLQVGLDGKAVRAVPLPFEGTVGGVVADPRESDVLYALQGWVRAPRILRFDPATHASVDTGLNPPSRIDTADYVSEEAWATSYDGTRVPLSIIHRRGLVRDGSHPTLVIGYGAYGISYDAYFSATRLAWLERGGVLAFAHIRGGGELGEAWHAAGQKRTKLNTVFDFIACGEYLVRQGYTTPARLAANGGSAGGITVGGAMNWRPDLFAVILDEVGMSDSLRSETEPNGPPNIVEFGSVKDKEGFHGLYAMSAYANVRDGAPYPAVMFLTGANDSRVGPWHSLKMTARVQAATSSGRPVLLRLDYDAGHGIGSNRSQREVELADMWSFALWQMGDPAFQPVK